MPKKIFTLWFTGLPSSGKTTLSLNVYNKLTATGLDVDYLDGDVLRKTITKNLGFTKEDRNRNIDQAISLAHETNNQKKHTVCAFITPYREKREQARNTIEHYIEVYVKCPLEVCEKRDVKGLYKKARAKEIDHFTGISDPYEEPQNPEITVATDQLSIEESSDLVFAYLKEHEYI